MVPVPPIYRRLGVRPIIHGCGTTTRYGGSILRPEALEAMREASMALVNIDELNDAAGAVIARMLGAEAAFVTAGASAGLILQAAACIAGADPTNITRLPDTAGMHNEIVIQRAHDAVYEAAQASVTQARPFREMLAAEPHVSARLTKAQIDALLDPTQYTGLCRMFAERGAAAARATAAGLTRSGQSA